MQSNDQRWEVLERRGNKVYRLPYRNLPDIAKLGWIGLGGALIFGLFIFGWMSGPIMAGVDMLQQGQAFGWAFIAFGCLGLLGLTPVLGILVASLALVRNRTYAEIEIGSDQLLDIQRLGWVRWKQRFPLPDIRAIGLTTDAKLSDRKSQKVNIFGEHLSGLVLLSESVENLGYLAIGYPAPILENLAKELSDSLSHMRSAGSTVQYVGQVEGKEAEAEIVERPKLNSRFERLRAEKAGATVTPSTDELIPSKPVESRIEVIEMPEQPTVYQMPANGLRGVVGATFGFFLLWTVFSGGIGTVMITTDIIGKPFDWEMLLQLGLMSLFLLVGLVGMFVSFRLSRSTAMIGVDETQLFWEVQGIFGKRWQQFLAPDIRTVQVGDSSAEVNGKPVRVLEVVTKDGKRFSEFGLWNDEELLWVAALLRRELGLRPRNENEEEVPNWELLLPEEGPFVLPQSVNLKLQSSVGYESMIVPAKGLSSVAVTLIVGVVFCGVAAGIAYFNFPFFAEPMLGVMSLIFGLVGLGLIVGSWLYAWRWFEIAVSRNELIVYRHRTARAVETFNWQSEPTLAVEIKDTGAKVNNQPMFALEISSETKPTFRMMWGRSEEELSCAAAFIHYHLPEIESAKRIEDAENQPPIETPEGAASLEDTQSKFWDSNS